jgi:DMSO/TMAO reductase YedYZ molybdopterin-dependent catalytic subunit
MTDPKPPVPIREVPRNAELHPEELRRAVTPSEAFFVRSNFPVPRLDPRTHAIRVGGAVEHPFAITVGELAAMEQRTLEVTTECAGNGRIGMHPPPTGEPWGALAVSTAVWTGVPLVHLLDRAGIGPGAVEVRFDGADGGEKAEAGARIDFARSLPLEKALDPDTLVAHRMNGTPLPPEHGAPVRLIVPGWYGMASVKWLEGIHVLTDPFHGFFQRDRYVYDPGGGEAPEPVTRMRVRSLIHTPGPARVVPPGPLEVRGWAWSGYARITRVEVALDGGDRWVEARLELRPDAPYAWVGWSCTVEVEERGRHLLRSRAHDEAGHVQPEVPPWNRLGYGQNGVQMVTFEVG